MSRRANRVKNDIVRELQKNPIVSNAIKRVDVSRATFYRWYDQDPHFAKRCNEAERIGRAAVIDFAESKLMTLVGNGNFQAIRLLLTTYSKPYKKDIKEEDPSKLGWADLLNIARRRKRQAEQDQSKS